MDPHLEIRKLSVEAITALTHILEPYSLWKNLMRIIPKQLSNSTFECSVTDNNVVKYKTEHFHSIETRAIHGNRSCTEILFDEWGTSGRIRPTIGHLLYLLKKAGLYRAADYVSITLLHQGPVERPLTGSAAFVDIHEHIPMEQMLEQMDYPSSGLENINKSSKNTIVPKIVITPNAEDHIPRLNSDLIQFSEEIMKSEDLPAFSDLLDSSQTENSQNESDSSSFTETSTNNQPVLPLLSFLANSETSNDNNSSGNNLPNLSAFQSSSNQVESTNLPDFNQLAPLEMPPNSRTCNSPLPTLSLNTVLPHFSYNELKVATDNFDETPIEKNGRFLGSGAFGQVFLATGLLGKPVAVKKIVLGDVETVLADDTVTKQFRNEVEVVSTYKHDNLVSLLGYSCDGCTYCLLYDYITGGALRDRLQDKENKLVWTERMRIAAGTADAVAYLHTAYSSPLIHRDIKTANILLDSTNTAKLCDFGLIITTINDGEDASVGTSAYMPPEAIRGDISVKLDTFSFGVVLLELLTSLPPIDESREDADLVTYFKQTCEETVDKILDVSVGPWKKGDIDFVQPLCEIVLSCLQDRKEDRSDMVQISAKLRGMQTHCD